MDASGLWTEPNLIELAARLQPLFPDLTLDESTTLLGLGFSTIVVETVDGVVLRIARRAEVGSRFAAERRWLPHIAYELPVEVPIPDWFAQDSEHFPYGVIGYRKVPGATPVPDVMTDAERSAFARQCGRVLGALHAIPLTGGAAQPINPNVRRRGWTGLRTSCRDFLKAELTDDEYALLDRWWVELLADDAMFDFVSVLVHGDFWYGNLLVKDGTISGVLDWENIGGDDPAVDFAAQLYQGEAFFEEMVAAYAETGEDAADRIHGIRARVGRLFALREFGGLQTAIASNDPVEALESVDKIRRSPILSPRGLDGWGA